LDLKIFICIFNDNKIILINYLLKFHILITTKYFGHYIDPKTHLRITKFKDIESRITGKLELTETTKRYDLKVKASLWGKVVRKLLNK